MAPIFGATALLVGVGPELSRVKLLCVGELGLALAPAVRWQANEAHLSRLAEWTAIGGCPQKSGSTAALT